MAKAQGPVHNLGPVGVRVAENLKQLRGTMTYKELSDRLDRLGRPIPVLGLSRIESNARRVDTDDLIALALALNVPPNRLLLPVDDAKVSLTPVIEDGQTGAWRWAYGEEASLEAAHLLEGPDSSYSDYTESFRRRGRPAREQRYENETAVRAAEDVLQLITSIIDERHRDHGTELRHLPRRLSPDSRPLPERLRGALKRLLAEVDDLPEVHDGER